MCGRRRAGHSTSVRYPANLLLTSPPDPADAPPIPPRTPRTRRPSGKTFGPAYARSRPLARNVLSRAGGGAAEARLRRGCVVASGEKLSNLRELATNSYELLAFSCELVTCSHEKPVTSHEMPANSCEKPAIAREEPDISYELPDNSCESRPSHMRSPPTHVKRSPARGDAAGRLAPLDRGGTAPVAPAAPAARGGVNRVLIGGSL